MKKIFLATTLTFLLSISAVLAADTYTLDLKPGWNLIGMSTNNVTIINTSGSISDLSYALNYSEGKWSEFSFKKLNNTNVSSGIGYWIYNFGDKIISLFIKDNNAANIQTNKIYFNYTRNLTKGWNLITGPNVEVDVNDVKGDCKKDYVWQWSNDKRDFDKQYRMVPGIGYWIYVNDKCRLEPTCSYRGGTCRAWDPINGNCYSNEKEIGAAECSNNLAQTRCCVPK